MEKRIKKIQSVLENNQAALILGGSNRFYFTGFKSSAGAVIITKDKAFLLVDFRYFEKANCTVNVAQVMLCQNMYSQIKEIFDNGGINKVFVETEEIGLGTFLNLENKLSGIEISKENTLQSVINELRQMKDRQEIEFIKIAQEITDKAFGYILDRIKVGKTEKEIALDLEFFARKNGSQGVAFDFIVVSGKNSSLPHGVPTDKQIKNGDFITMDFGAKWNGYCSDMTRTVAVGNISDEQRKVYDTVLTAQKMALQKIKAGAMCKEIDAIARDYIYSCGYEGCFGHGLGHSVGIDIHESPTFNTRDNTVLKSGMVMTVEPGIYIENKFGVRIEDMVVVTDDGYKNFTQSPKELIVLCKGEV